MAAGGETQHRSGRHPGYDRLAFEWAEPMSWSMRQEGVAVVFEFERAPGLDAEWIASAFPRRIRHVALTETTLELFLNEPYRTSDLAVRGGRVLALDIHSDQLRDSVAALPTAPPKRRPTHLAEAATLLPTESGDAEGASAHEGRGAGEPTETPPVDHATHDAADADSHPTDALGGEIHEAHASDGDEHGVAHVTTLPELAMDRSAALDRQDLESSLELLLPPRPNADTHSGDGEIVASHDADHAAEPRDVAGPLDHGAPHTVPSAAVDHAPKAGVETEAVPDAHAGESDLHPADAEAAATEPVESVDPSADLTLAGLGDDEAQEGLRSQEAPADLPGVAAPTEVLEIVAADGGLHFAAATPTALAVLQRGSELFIAFDRPLRIVGPDPAIDWNVAEAPSRTGTFLTLQIPSAEPWHVERMGLRWLLRPGVGPPSPPLEAAMPDGAVAVDLIDPWLGDRMWLIPTANLSHLPAAIRQGPQRWLQTVQGLAVRGDMPASPAAAGAGAHDNGRDGEPMPSGNSPLFDLHDPALRHADRSSRQDLQRRLAALPTAENRLALTRHLLVEGLPEEALALLDAAAPGTFDDPGDAVQRQALTAVANVLRAAPEAAFDELGALDGYRDDPEWSLWHALAAGAMHDWSVAGLDLVRSGHVWRRYPADLQVDVARRIATIAMALGETRVAIDVVDHALALEPDSTAEGWLNLTRAEARLMSGDTLGLDEVLNELSGHETSAIALRAHLLFRELKAADDPSLWASYLEWLLAERDRWRGHPHETVYLRRLAEAQTADGDPLAAIATLDEIMATETGLAELADTRNRQVALLRQAIEPGPLAADLPQALDAAAMLDAYKVDPLTGAELRGLLAARIARESQALDVADTNLVHAINLAGADPLADRLRLQLAELRLDRGLPSEAARTLATLPQDLAIDPALQAKFDAAGLPEAGPKPPSALAATAQEPATVSRDGTESADLADDPSGSLGSRARNMLSQADALIEELLAPNTPE